MDDMINDNFRFDRRYFFLLMRMVNEGFDTIFIVMIGREYLILKFDSF